DNPVATLHHIWIHGESGKHTLHLLQNSKQRVARIRQRTRVYEHSFAKSSPEASHVATFVCDFV
ncbi:hypothetical protein, partial [Ralstonia sp.]|uniref:hypothetical protein n=1 Tax=Ralstonia sp. TaxID=54061 RepID=UPI003979C5E1